MRVAPRKLVAPLLAIVVSLAPVGVTHAQGTPDEASQGDRADQLFAQGTELFMQGRYVDALDVFRQSHKLVPSPNSGLLIARCLSRLGRSAEAAEVFASVEAEARQRAARGEARYTATAEAAANEGAAIRATLGAVRIRVPPSDDARLDVAGLPVAIPAEGDGRRA